MSTPDKWARAELPTDWPIAEALEGVASRIGALRVAVLRPFDKASVERADLTVEDRPSVITRWRNRPTDSAIPTLILGDARGDEEHGLRQLPEIILDRQVLDRWRDALLRWIHDNVESKTVPPLVAQLLELTHSGAVDATRLDEYLTASLADRKLALARLRSEMWRVSLLPDDRALDAGEARSRVRMNLQTRQLLLSASDSPADLARLSRLSEAAQGGDKTAADALTYRDTRDPAILRGVELGKLFAILSPRSKSPAPARRSLSLLGVLDEGGSADGIRQILERLAAGWDLFGRDEQELIAAIDPSGGSPREVRVEVTPLSIERSIWIGDGAPENQVLAYMAESAAERDWRSTPARSITGAQLLQLARDQDSIFGSSRFAEPASEYIAARLALAPHERWLRASAFPLLLLQPTARRAVRDFLAAWQALMETANSAAPGGADVIRRDLVLLEALWGGKTSPTEEFEWCVLGPFHPYALDPLLRLADYVIAQLGTPQLGKRVTWALDRSLPAYRVIWAPNATLFLTKEDDLFEFEISPSAHHPPARSGDGISQVARSFVGFHAFASQNLVITLIDPPKGGAVSENIRKLKQEIPALRVYLVITSKDAAPLEELGEHVRHLGRFDSVEDWLSRAPMRSHIVFYFAERPAGMAKPAGAGWGPTPGAHVALKVGLEAASAFGASGELVPFVTFEPRMNNGPVVAIQRLAAPTIGAPRLFQIRPTMSTSGIATLSRIRETADWVVLGAPAPLGFVAPRELGASVTYLGREQVGTYELFVYATDLFAVRKVVTEGLRLAPVVTEPTRVEARLTELAIQSTNGVLRMGRSHDGPMWEQVGLIMASALSQELVEREAKRD